MDDDFSVLDLGLTLPELRALGLDQNLSTLELTQALGAMHLLDLRRFASALGLPSRGNSEATIERILSYYDQVEHTP